MFWKVFGIVCGAGLAIGIGVGTVIAVKQHKSEPKTVSSKPVNEPKKA